MSGSWYIKGNDESVTRVDSVSLMYHDPSDLGSLIQIQITPEERTPYRTANISADGFIFGLFFSPKLKSSKIFASNVSRKRHERVG